MPIAISSAAPTQCAAWPRVLATTPAQQEAEDGHAGLEGSEDHSYAQPCLCINSADSDAD
jgi:hypothetical protein